ncbi:MAG TPA: universal stress protein [Acetobacteraceae bacterium]|nr:universal stress protein [Acetobacteraceae bacterium]
MLRSILVALDDTPGAQAARDAAIALARRTGAALSMAVVLDRPHTASDHEFVPVGGAAFKARRDAKLTAQAEEEARQALEAAQAVAGDLPFEVLRLEEAPEPALLRAGATHDLILVGRDSTLGREQTEDDVAPVIGELLRDGARPLLVVPPGGILRAEGPVLVGYDASLPAMAALQLFALLGLAEGSPVRVVSADADRDAASRMAEQGASYLRRHGLSVTAHAITGGRPADLLLAEADAMDARLLVCGAFENTGLTRMLTGSATRTLLRHARLPLFIHH